MEKGLSFRKKKVHKIKWWHVFIGILALLCIAVVMLICNITGRLNSGSPDIVKGVISEDNIWNDLVSNPTMTTSTGSEITESELDDDSFTDIDTKNYPIISVNQKDPNIENILIIGVDGTTNKGHRSDVLMVASINTKNNTLKLTSILRDIKVYFPDRKISTKVNAAFAFGGAGYAIDIINYNFNLDIQKYVTINFSGFENIINSLGGVTLTLTKAEATSDGVGLTSAGTYTLNGHQALMYSRIRHIDSDFKRVQRQKNVILAIYNKFKNVGIPKKVAAVNKCLDYFKTNIPSTELLGTLINFSSVMKSNIEQYVVPQVGMYSSTSTGIYYINLDWDKQLAGMNSFIYGG